MTSVGADTLTATIGLFGNSARQYVQALRTLSVTRRIQYWNVRSRQGRPGSRTGLSRSGADFPDSSHRAIRSGHGLVSLWPCGWTACRNRDLQGFVKDQKRGRPWPPLLSCLPLRGSGDSVEEIRICIHDGAFRFIRQDRGNVRCRQTLGRIAIQIVALYSWHGPRGRGQSPRRYGVNVVAHNPCFPVAEGRNQLHRELVITVQRR